MKTIEIETKATYDDLIAELYLLHVPEPNAVAKVYEQCFNTYEEMIDAVREDYQQ